MHATVNSIGTLHTVAFEHIDLQATEAKKKKINKGYVAGIPHFLPIGGSKLNSIFNLKVLNTTPGGVSHKYIGLFGFF